MKTVAALLAARLFLDALYLDVPSAPVQLVLFPYALHVLFLGAVVQVFVAAVVVLQLVAFVPKNYVDPSLMNCPIITR